MKILYGVPTTGNGHINRSRLMIAALKAQGHSVTALFSGPKRPAFWSDASFESCIELVGLTLATENGQVSYFKTALQAQPMKLLHDIRTIDLRPYDLVFSDFEPISAYAAKRAKVTSIGLSNQAAHHYDIPKQNGYLLARGVMKYYAPAQHQLGLHWHHFSQPILPPIIDPSLSCSCEVQDDLILVYLPFENRTEVLKLLQANKTHRFHLYSQVDAIEQHENVLIHPFSRTHFIADLQRCSGVICQAGFELPSEALHLGKKLLVKPVQNQYEQICNANTLLQNKLGQVMNQLNPDSIAEFLHSAMPIARNYPNVSQAVAHWVSSADLNAPHASMELVRKLW